MGSMKQLDPGYELFPYQQVALDKLVQSNAVLCGDDMGLGKTLEAIATDREWRLKSGTYWSKTLVVSPLSVLGTWEEHYAWALPGLDVYCIDPKNRPAFARALKEDYQVYLIHWDALRLLRVQLKDVEWFNIIGDEIHRAKNRKAQSTQVLKSLKTQHKFGASGTPADSKPHDLWSILHWLYPKKYTSYWRFYKEHVEYDPDPRGYHKITGVKNTDQLLRDIEPFYIRRRKEQVLKDLPDKYYTTAWVDLAPAQRKAYDQLRKNSLTWVDSNFGEDVPLSAPEAITKLIRLQQFAIGTIELEKYRKRELNKKWDSTRPTELYNRKRWNDPTHNWKWRVVDAIRANIVDPSIKISTVMDLLEDSTEPVVVFSQFKSAINLLAKHMAKEKMPFGLITGDVEERARRNHVINFQAGRYKCMAGTISAGGVGITLTRSSHVVFIDRCWKQALNRQAEDRLHRVGQKNAVQVTDLMARNTVDLGRHQQIQEQWGWLQMMLGDETLDYQQRGHMMEEKSWI